jgi:hypothetical protein
MKIGAARRADGFLPALKYAVPVACPGMTGGLIKVSLLICVPPAFLSTLAKWPSRPQPTQAAIEPQFYHPLEPMPVTRKQFEERGFIAALNLLAQFDRFAGFVSHVTPD